MLTSLAGKINFLLDGRNHASYLKYFNWRKTPETQTCELQTLEQFSNAGICQLCKMAKEGGFHGVVDDLQSWWYGQREGGVNRESVCLKNDVIYD